MDLSRRKDENEESFIWRLGQAKDSGILDISWTEIANIINKEFQKDTPYSEATYRKPYQQAKKFYESGVFKKLSDDTYFRELELQRQEIKKEKVRLSDERTDLNRRLRETARREEDLECLKNEIRKIGKNRYFYYSPLTIRSDTDMVVCLSDLHIGSEYAVPEVQYNSETAKRRLDEYLCKVIDIGNRHSVQKVIVVGLGDFISGSIHKTTSITNRENVVEQIKLVCELVSDFVYELGSYFNEIEVHVVGGNHSRIDKKNDALLDERLDLLLPWFMKHIFSHLDNIIVIDKEKDSSLCTFYVRGKLFFGCHGDLDSINDTSIGKLCLWAKMTPYCILMGHRHYSAMSEISNIKVIQSGSLCGSGDNYTREKRLTGDPSQMVLICNDDGIQCMYPVQLK